MPELQEATKEFLIESHENLDQLDADLVGLEEATAPAEALGRIFRTLHTIKGSCSFLGFPHLEAVAHAGKNLLGKLRDGKLDLNPVITDALLRMVDAIRTMLSAIENTGHDDGVEASGLIERESVRAAGGQILVQDEASSVVWSMPGAVAQAGLADRVLPLEQVGPEIVRRVQRS